MATANTYLQVTDLDFGQIRANLKNYLSTQDQFKDYDYEGSTMATLLDILAYNTHYNAYYLNMLANEMFLDTAQQRDSVVSRAKELGYTPSSSIGATANINLSFAGVSANTPEVIVPRNSKFTTTVDDVKYTYVTPETYKVANIGGTFAKDILIREGEPVQYKWTVSSSNPARYILPNINVDTSSIVVKVQESVTDTTTTEFTRATDIKEVYQTSPIYFLEEAGDNKYEIVFGQGAIGKSVKNGNIVIVDYLVCNGTETNGASTFKIDSLSGITTPYTAASINTVNTVARGGRYQESIDSIKFNAPKSYQTQNRAVVSNDYERILTAENPDLQTVIAFGGETRIPAVYGKVYIAVKPYNNYYLTTNRKTQIKSSIIDRTPLGIDPVIIDPDYTFLVPYIETYFDRTTSTVTYAQIEQEIRRIVSVYNTNNLGKFKDKMRYSRFVRALDNITIGNILNTNATFKMQKRFTPSTDYRQKFTLKFNNDIVPGSLESSAFIFNDFTCYFEDDNGTINMYRYDDDKNKVSVNKNSGTIDYVTGTVIIDQFQPSSITGIEMKITVDPDTHDIVTSEEQILVIENQDVTVNVVGEAT